MKKAALSSILVVVVLFTLALIAEAQQPKKVWRIGLFHVGLDHIPPSLQPLKQALKEFGYEEEKNIRLDWRNLPDEEAARVTAQEFVRDRVDLIVAYENQTARAAKAATSDIPVVILHVTDPVATGLVKSLSRPGGNLTGIVGFRDLTGKQLELFKEVVPRLRRVLALVDPQDPVTPRLLGQFREVGANLKVKLLEQDVTDQTDIERVFRLVKGGDVDGVFIVSPNIQTKYSSLVIRLASEKHLPVPSHRKEWVEQGALFSYGPNYVAVGRASAIYIDKILKGTKPADLPVEQASQIELVISLKTAKQIGLTIPPNVLARADKVIK